jgi:hypothetical protein
MSGDIIYIEVIAETDYDAFRSLMGNELADTFDEWRERHQQRISGYAHCDLRKFAEYLNATGRAPTMSNLLAFAQLTWEGYA